MIQEEFWSGGLIHGYLIFVFLADPQRYRSLLVRMNRWPSCSQDLRESPFVLRSRTCGWLLAAAGNKPSSDESH